MTSACLIIHLHYFNLGLLSIIGQCFKLLSFNHNHQLSLLSLHGDLVAQPHPCHFHLKDCVVKHLSISIFDNTCPLAPSSSSFSSSLGYSFPWLSVTVTTTLREDRKPHTVCATKHPEQPSPQPLRQIEVRARFSTSWRVSQDGRDVTSSYITHTSTQETSE